MLPFVPVPDRQVCTKFTSTCLGDLHSEFFYTTHACGEEGGDC